MPASADTGTPVEVPVQEDSSENQAVDSSMGQLVISYEKSCWTDIRDAAGQKLVYRTVAAGETITVEGQKPLELFFGFAVGIDLVYNGKQIDLKQYTDGVFARLTLGE